MRQEHNIQKSLNYQFNGTVTISRKAPKLNEMRGFTIVKDKFAESEKDVIYKILSPLHSPRYIQR
jgi:hypothetical protein